MDLIKEIAKELKKLFPGTHIYRESIKQSFKTPSFYVYEVNATSSYELADYQKRTRNYCVMFFPDSTKDLKLKQQCADVEAVLLDEFDFLNDVKLKIKDREFKMIDDDLQLLFKLEYRVAKEKDNRYVKTLEQHLKGE